MRPSVILLFLFLWNAKPGLAQEDTMQLSIRTTPDRSFILNDPQEVLQHEGELITLEGCIASAKLAEWVKGQPIFLNLYADYPENVVSAVIWEEDRAQFLPAADYHQKRVRITGKVKLKTSTQPGKAPKVRATITLHNPQQITILDHCTATKN